MVAYSRTTASKLYGFGGQPGRFTTGFSVRIESTPVAPVGFGPDDGTPPQEAHEPIAITAAAFWPTSFNTCIAGRPASFMYCPWSLVGIEPSTTRTNFPRF